MIHLQGVNRLLLGSNHYLGLSSQQHIRRRPAAGAEPAAGDHPQARLRGAARPARRAAAERAAAARAALRAEYLAPPSPAGRGCRRAGEGGRGEWLACRYPSPRPLPGGRGGDGCSLLVQHRHQQQRVHRPKTLRPIATITPWSLMPRPASMVQPPGSGIRPLRSCMPPPGSRRSPPRRWPCPPGRPRAPAR